MQALEFLTPGRMPLPFAWLVAGGAVPVVLFLVAVVGADTPLNEPLFVVLLVGSVVIAPIIAWRKGRRWWLWVVMAGAAVWLQLIFQLTILSPVLQPVTVAAAVALARPAAPRFSSKGDMAQQALAGDDAANHLPLPAPPPERPQGPAKPFRSHRRGRR